MNWLRRFFRELRDMKTVDAVMTVMLVCIAVPISIVGFVISIMLLYLTGAAMLSAIMTIGG